MPDQVLGVASLGPFPQPEWAARLPVFSLTIIASRCCTARSCRASAGERRFSAGSCADRYAVLVPARPPEHDRHAVRGAAHDGARLLLLGVQTDPERAGSRVLGTARGKELCFSARHVVLGLVLVTVLPQVLLPLLASPHAAARRALRTASAGTWTSSSRVRGGNCGIPGNAECVRSLPLDRDLPARHRGADLVRDARDLPALLNRDEALPPASLLPARLVLHRARRHGARALPASCCRSPSRPVSLAATRRFRELRAARAAGDAA